MRQFKTVKSFTETMQGVKLPKGGVCGCYKGVYYYCDHLNWKRVVSPRNGKRWYQIHIHVYDEKTMTWNVGRNKRYNELCEFVAGKIKQYGLEKTKVEYPLMYKEAGVLPRVRKAQSNKGYTFKIQGNLHDRTMTEVDAVRPYRVNVEYENNSKASELGENPYFQLKRRRLKGKRY